MALILADVQLEDKNWIQDANADIEKRGTKGKCTPITKPGCTGKAKALAKTFKKMGEAGDEQVVSDEDDAPVSSKSAKSKKKKMKRVKSK